MQWNQTFGSGDDRDQVYSVKQTSDGGYIIAGVGAWIDGYYTNFGSMLVKTSSTGTVEWKRHYGYHSGETQGEARSVLQTSDGGYVFAGNVEVAMGDPWTEFWLVRTNAAGDMVWNQTYGGYNGYERAYSVQQTRDGGYILAGESVGAATVETGSWDSMLVKTSAVGEMAWSRLYGEPGYGPGTGPNLESAYCVQQTLDGGYIAAGSLSEFDAYGSLLTVKGGWVVKTNPAGAMQWNMTYKDIFANIFQFDSVLQTSDGGYLLFGSGWLVKTTSTGYLEWQTWTGPGAATCMDTTWDGGFIIGGQATQEPPTNSDFWLKKFGYDADGDGFSNSWEREGIDYNGDGIIDLNLPALGADWRHKDIFVEVDYMNGHDFFAAGRTEVESAFANAPVNNPDGTTGIRLHIDVDEQIPHQDLVKRDFSLDFMPLKNSYFGTADQRVGANSPNVLDAKSLVYHYCLFVDKISDWNGTQWKETNFAGLGECPGNDFIVAMGGFPGGTGTAEDQASAFMHELGHNLGLNHGGATSDKINYKPNYLSVMNYAFAFPDWVVPWRPLDYSRSELPTLYEASLDEPYGVQGYGFWQYTIWNDSKSVRAFGLVTGPLDWNGNKNDTEWFVRANINNFPAPGWNYPSDPDEVLEGHDDWSHLKYYFMDTQGFVDGVYLTVSQDEITSDTVEAMRASRLAMHEVGVYNVTANVPVWTEGTTLSVTLTMGNLGGSNESVNASVYANSTLVASSTLTLVAGNLTTATLPYSGQILSPGNYTLKAVVSPVTGETYTADNTVVGSVIRVTGVIPEFPPAVMLSTLVILTLALTLLSSRKQRRRTQ
jgi:hypothetical protein